MSLLNKWSLCPGSFNGTRFVSPLKLLAGNLEVDVLIDQERIPKLYAFQQVLKIFSFLGLLLKTMETIVVFS